MRPVSDGHPYISICREAAIGRRDLQLQNKDTNYRNGVDSHVDWALAQFLNEQALVDLVGYGYYQLTRGQWYRRNARSNKAQVYAVGPAGGILLSVRRRPGYINLRGYWEFGAKRRLEGWNLWLTLILPLAGSK